MSDKYNQIMDEINVTEEMQNRILQNIEQRKTESKPQAINFKLVLKILVPVAACFLLVVGIFWYKSSVNEMPQDVQITNPIMQVSSARELSNLLGFDVPEIKGLPFTVCDTFYTSYDSQLGEIKYIGENASCVFRKSKGTEDISGDYTSYPYEEQSIIGNNTVLLRGESPGSLNLAVWSDETYSYALSFSDGVSLKTAQQTILSVSNRKE